jgi:hypothetical protein
MNELRRIIIARQPIALIARNDEQQRSYASTGA